MTTATIERQKQLAGASPDRDSPREQFDVDRLAGTTWRTAAVLLLGAVCLLLVLTVLATLRIAYRPYRGC